MAHPEYLSKPHFESRTYRVVENDVDVHAIWRVARSSGFADLDREPDRESPIVNP
jgi:hypothetical protein